MKLIKDNKISTLVRKVLILKKYGDKVKNQEIF